MSGPAQITNQERIIQHIRDAVRSAPSVNPDAYFQKAVVYGDVEKPKRATQRKKSTAKTSKKSPVKTATKKSPKKTAAKKTTSPKKAASKSRSRSRSPTPVRGRSPTKKMTASSHVSPSAGREKSPFRGDLVAPESDETARRALVSLIQEKLTANQLTALHRRAYPLVEILSEKPINELEGLANTKRPALNKFLAEERTAYFEKSGKTPKRSKTEPKRTRSRSKTPERARSSSAGRSRSKTPQRARSSSASRSRSPGKGALTREELIQAILKRISKSNMKTLSTGGYDIEKALNNAKIKKDRIKTILAIKGAKDLMDELKSIKAEFKQRAATEPKRASPRKKSSSPRKKSASPKKSTSPRKKSASPKRAATPPKSSSPKKTSAKRAKTTSKRQETSVKGVNLPRSKTAPKRATKKTIPLADAQELVAAAIATEAVVASDAVLNLLARLEASSGRQKGGQGFSVAELKEELKRHNLATGGKKEDMIKRLRDKLMEQ